MEVEGAEGLRLRVRVTWGLVGNRPFPALERMEGPGFASLCHENMAELAAAAHDTFLFMEHKATMRRLWVSRSLVECASTLVGGWPYNHSGHHGMAVLHPVNSWNNSAAKKDYFSSTGSS